MILDILQNGDRYRALHPLLPTALALLGRADLRHLPAGRIEIDGEALYAVVMQGPGKPAEGARLEIHDRYVDLHYLIAGQERIGWKPRAELRTAAERAGNDAAFHAEAPDLWLPMRPGMFAVFFPEDAHMPMIGDADIRKVVVKLAL